MRMASMRLTGVRLSVAVLLLLSLLITAAAEALPTDPEAVTPTFPPCVSRGDDPNHEHEYGDDWVSYTIHTHSARCQYPGCTRWERILCNEVNVETGNGEVAICPVCGAVTRGHITLMQATRLTDAVITDSAAPGEWHGDPVAYMAQLDEDTLVVSVSYACHGATQPHTMDVRLELTGEAAETLSQYELMAIAGAQDLNLSVTYEEGKAILTMRFARRPAAVLVFSK